MNFVRFAGTVIGSSVVVTAMLAGVMKAIMVFQARSAASASAKPFVTAK